MSELDLTKPLRIKHSQERFYPCPDLTNDRWLHGLCLGFETGPIGMPKVQKFLPATVHRGELENIPEPLARYIRVKLDIDSCCGASAWFGRLHHSLPPEDNDPVLRGTTLLKLTRTEDGKTHVEVVDG